ncbi:hypothetical protein CGLO_06092 [Colletotrichum gloeosporioides Cg-14]|uniref:Uncharacterized protein n=1 Tax=Colletotrichum gloeosporioides (strain Cg-14) TaxID=1237896 RepID=T0LZY1_COLGC|nr:hypothetical protein CGLO_06092 [Colletotrichum gloeosporioides Cg-14]
MLREDTHKNVMNYNDYASQPLIRRFHADMEREESAEDWRKDSEEKDDEPQTVSPFIYALTESPSSPPRYFELFKILHTISWI